jgi:aspartyl-tRNA(Asn)/glutamyl-tRNA(Gln) amidotransferase subunit C
MKHLNEEAIDKLAELCRIEVTSEEKSSLLKDLERVLAYVDQLQEVSVENVPACNSVLTELHNVFREDEVKDVLSREAFLANCPEHTGGLVKVPPILQKTSKNTKGH